jgi:hypothetical protein
MIFDRIERYHRLLYISRNRLADGDLEKEIEVILPLLKNERLDGKNLPVII